MGDSALRLRQNSSGKPGEDLDVLIKYHHSMQEKIAENMLSMAKNLKEQSEVASAIIKKDTEVIMHCRYINNGVKFFYNFIVDRYKIGENNR